MLETTTDEPPAQRVTPDPANRFRAGTYGAYFGDLLEEMKARPSLLYLSTYLLEFGCPSAFSKYAARDAAAPDIKALDARGLDWVWHQRQWDHRERAREIIEGVAPWPSRLLPWKHLHELRYHHGYTDRLPGWLDPRNWPDPLQQPEHDPRALPSKRRRLQSLQRELAGRRGRRRACA